MFWALIKTAAAVSLAVGMWRAFMRSDGKRLARLSAAFGACLLWLIAF